MPLPRTLDVATSWLASLARFLGGLHLSPLGPRPAQQLILYEFEGCPFCRRVREAITALDLEVLIRPCPKGGQRFRAEVKARGGKTMFPYLVDPNQGVELYESVDIVRHLYKHYGTGSAPWGLVGPLFLPSSMLASAIRLGRGSRYQGARSPAEPLVLYGLEASGYTRLAREVLSELELPYVLRTTATGSSRWREVKKLGGQAMVPYLVDPNTGAAMYESADIVAYLRTTYG
jgi:glutathione S-transferase